MKTELEHTERYRYVGVKLIKGQVDLLDDCVKLTGQTRTELVREALAGFLSKLHRQLTNAHKGDDHDETMD